MADLLLSRGTVVKAEKMKEERRKRKRREGRRKNKRGREEIREWE